MKNISAMALRLSLVICVLCLASDSRTKTQTAAPASARKPVIVELFTSEGCSTCPPADALLQELEEQQPIDGADVVPLEEHVTYWNQLGWNDPYSSLEWTQRQVVYKEVFKTKEVYTPQMVVNGQAKFVGNNEQEAVIEIAKAAQRVETDVAITSEKPDARGSQHFTVSVGKLVGNATGDTAEVWLAVTEDGLESNVNRGENSGQVLHHVATLRSLRKIGVADPNKAPASFTSDPRVKLDSHWNPDNLHVVVFVQEEKNRQILGAVSAKISR
jgi:hypothetical protein